MTEKEWKIKWDDDLKYLILAFVNETINSLKPKKKISIKKFEKIQADIFDLALRDRKHQKSEMLKRLPSPQEFMDFLLHLHEKSLRLRKPVTRKDEATAIHKLVKDKLK